MKFIGSHEIFGLLLDITQFVGRNQFRRDRRIHDVEQCLRSHLTRYIGDEVTDERLGHTGIDAIHRHVITIIGGPSQSEFREITSTDDDGILLVGNIHQNLRALSGL